MNDPLNEISMLRPINFFVYVFLNYLRYFCDFGWFCGLVFKEGRRFDTFTHVQKKIAHSFATYQLLEK